MHITQLTSFTDREFREMKALVEALSTHCILSPTLLQQAVEKAQVFVMRNEDGSIIGTATLSLFFSPTGRKASIEDVVILPKFRGKGLGRELVEFLIATAKQYSPITLQLTSRPSRTAANALYQKLGFQQKETNCYIMKIQ